MIDFALYALFRTIVFVMRFLPLGFWLACGRACGSVYYFFDRKKTRRSFLHLKIAFPEKSCFERKRIIKAMYRNFGQNIMESLYSPYMDTAFLKKHIEISGLDELEKAKKRPAGMPGMVFLGVHAGSWELSNMLSCSLFPPGDYAMLVRPQKGTKRIDSFIQSIRGSKGMRVIRIDELKAMVMHLKQNKVLGSVADHGGKEGLAVPFFGKLAMTPAGILKLAKKTGSVIILAFMRRKRGPYHEMFFRLFEPLSGREDEEGLRADLTAINHVYEEWISNYPEEYLWFYKRWKNSPQKNILVLSDAKPGHVKQSMALVGMLKSEGSEVELATEEVKFRNVFCSGLLSLAAFIGGGALAAKFLKQCVSRESFKGLTARAFDIVISTGSSLASVNLAVSRENAAVSFAVMKPGIVPCGRFDAVVIPEHDLPPKKTNIIPVQGALNSITPEGLEKDLCKLISARPLLADVAASTALKIGFLVGGDSRHYKLERSSVDAVSSQLKDLFRKNHGYVFISTSRRTPDSVVLALKEAWGRENACKLLVIASEDNPEGAIGGILRLSDIVIVTGESISMVSEAVASRKYVVVFEPKRLSVENKVRKFLEKMHAAKCIYLARPDKINDRLLWILKTRPVKPVIDQRVRIIETLKKII